ncbi:MAG: methionyl-tRNA formyltransferase [Acidobacteria bacterium]|nr:methionyl-tRNA formyltransferase [Acidobacteriota bacterium]MBU4307394.1 methionyl-tRNA formyltransferase [Acidobacteriota bacterium]MBU4404646.1 methionyl-tRNA formyltransferase [Acidobacteriota bacterium]MCG2811615.1 methionyl-tRNA formyltransferase [Candidatus Aminicenantes bacterium]
MANGELFFFGTAAIGLPILKELNRNFNLKLIITQPDTRGGRNRQLLVPAVKQFAMENRLPYIQPPDLREPELELAMRRIDPAIAVVVAYGQFIPRAVYSLPRYRTINVHFSLLPAYRGAAPVQRALENGESRSGITIFEISSRMDSGPVWAQEEIAIRPEDTTTSYQLRLGERAAPFLLQTLNQIFSGKIRKHPQDDSLATLAPAVKKSEGQVDWRLPAQRLYDRLRAFTPWPGLFFSLEKRQIKILNARVSGKEHHGQAGQILALDAQGLLVGCGLKTVLEIIDIQPEGKKAMSPWQFSLGNRFPELLS